MTELTIELLEEKAARNVASGYLAKIDDGMYDITDEGRKYIDMTRHMETLNRSVVVEVSGDKARVVEFFDQVAAVFPENFRVMRKKRKSVLYYGRASYTVTLEADHPLDDISILEHAADES